ncbi:uncharacterized protein IUM83_10928 [Phytophthora cinnamomi]|uniref:uncharacterized protein n=1 Tax=Phytophthora cinnamomi TaxID=4785 RepID=UPI00355A1875|nr:hypothetical protein IUM83_10928 [Phytophthora cinnamomi]
MDLPITSRLYSAAIAAAKYADHRLETRTRTDYNSSLRRFAAFCQNEGYPDPLKHRFVELPGVVAAYINQLATTNTSQWPAEKLRAALSWHYTKPEMLTGGHPHDRWVVDTSSDGTLVPRGNPARSAAITQILAGLSKSKKRERTPKRASPMSLTMLTRMITFLESNSVINETMRLWFSAVCSLSFYGMCRINEVLQMKKGDIHLGLQRKSRKGNATIRFGCFTIRDRKTDHDPLASRTYSLHHLPKEEQAAESLTYLERWFTHASSKLHHIWRDTDYAFPALTKVPRNGSKKRKGGAATAIDGTTFANVGVKWGSPMSDSNFTKVLNIVAEAAGISRNLLGDEIWFTSHCFRRGGAQYRFMFAPEKRRWSLKLVKWWAGWAPSEKAETVTRYLLDDVLDREENVLGDSLAPDSVSCSDAALESIRSLDYGDAQMNSDGTEELQATMSPPDVHESVSGIGELKSLLEGLRQMVKNIAETQGSTQETVLEDPATVTDVVATHLVSELPDAKSWRDYVNQYWKANPACHQYRAGVDMLPHERKLHRSRLSRMKIIAEFIRDEYNNDEALFEKEFASDVQGELTVNRILTAIRKRRRTKG